LTSTSEEQGTVDHRPGLFGRLFARGGNKARADEGEPNGMLLALLERLNWPGQLSERVIALRDRLLDQPRNGEWVEVIEELVAGISETLGDAQAKIRDTEGFLSQLTERLGEIDSHVQGAQGDQKAALDSGRQLTESVSEEVSGIGESMRAASDLKQLQGLIHKRLDAIQSHVQMHLEGEEARFEKAQQGAMETWERLRTLEAESGNLRRRIADLHRKALRDTVTHLPNRMACEDRMKQEFARWKRFQDPLTLMVWDIDNFKGINDHYGHQAGDKALRAVAKTLKKRLRETDFIGRYGGEEFVVLLPGAPQPDALRIANEMRIAIETAGFHAGSKPVAMTISCGISEFRDGDSAESVFERADKALYAAKSGGKNRCECA
jgi:diguanylate cyclase